MQPYYDQSGITIYHGDCLEIMPQLSKVDLVLTDPPYMEYQSNYRHLKHKRIEKPQNIFVTIRELIEMPLMASYIFSRWDLLYYMPKPKSLIAWVKNNWSMGDLKHEHGRQWEAICFYPNTNHEFNKRIPDVIHAKRTLNNLHPTEKPIDLLNKIILANKGDIILDPFMGSGTILRAAKDLGRKAIGIEIEEKYCEIAVKRLAQEVLPF